MVFGLLALTVAAFYSGAASWVSFVEHPARSRLDERAQLEAWKASSVRGTVMQASLAVLGIVLGGVAWYFTGDLRWLVGALVLLVIRPYALVAIVPVDKALMAISPSEAGPASRALLDRWGRLHAVRTALGLVAMAIFLWATIA